MDKKDHHQEYVEEMSSSGKVFFILSIIIIGLVIIAVFVGFLNRPNANTIKTEFFEYNGFNFFYDGVTWSTQINRYVFLNETNADLTEIQLQRSYSPRDVENITYSFNSNFIINRTNVLYISFDENIGQSIAIAGIAIKNPLVFVSNIHPSRIIVATTTVSEEVNYPVIDCSNATRDNKVITFKLNDLNQTTVFENEEGTCIEASLANSKDAVKVADLIIYRLYGIIK